MVKAVLDSSVLISAFLTPLGVPGQLLEAARREVFACCLSREILAETENVLLRAAKLQARYRYDEAAAKLFCAGLAAAIELVSGLPNLRAVPLDPKDDMVVATAVAAGADCLVTGDRRHLLSMRVYQGIRILTPRQLFEEL